MYDDSSSQPPSDPPLDPAPARPASPGRLLAVTVLWAVAVFVFYFTLQGLTMGLVWKVGLGFAFWLGTLVAAPFGMAALALAAHWSPQRISIADRLGLRLPTRRQALLAFAAVTAVNLVYDQLSRGLGRPTVPDFMLDVVRSAHGLPGLYLALVVAAPAFEELLFRGFLLPGLQPALGTVGAALVSSAAFALPHVQYDGFDVACVFLLGLLFATVRLKTGSTVLTFGLHALTNLIATLQTAWVLTHPGR